MKHGVAGILIMAGCVAATEPSVEQDTAAIEPAAVACPDHTTSCTQPNGPGVYFGESGTAGIDDLRFLITYFQNDSTGVMFQGRYRDEVSHRWLELDEPGQVLTARYRDATWRVVSVSEIATLPTWTLRSQAGETVALTGNDLRDATFNLVFATPSSPRHRYILGFGDRRIDTGHQRDVHSYPMQWREWSGASTWKPYCLPSPYSPVTDTVVFQQGFAIHPLTGRVVRGIDAERQVTLSCKSGAPATVYSWGYDYQGTRDDTFYFDAGIHMKRAAYCGDHRYFTTTGVSIAIWDDRAIHSELTPHLEAYWTRAGASCLNPGHRRASLPAFDGLCDGTPLPACEPPEDVRVRLISSPRR